MMLLENNAVPMLLNRQSSVDSAKAIVVPDKIAVPVVDIDLGEWFDQVEEKMVQDDHLELFSGLMDEAPEAEKELQVRLNAMAEQKFDDKELLNVFADFDAENSSDGEEEVKQEIQVAQEQIVNVVKEDEDNFQLDMWIDQAEADCIDHARKQKLTPCPKKLKCGHDCHGFEHEKECLPCMDASCDAEDKIEDELCAICYTTELSSDPCVKLNCGHIYHVECVGELLKHKWSTLKVSFAFMSCPSCKTPIETDLQCHKLEDQLSALSDQKKKVEEEALKVAENQGLLQHERLSDPNDHFFEKQLEYALYKCSFYECFDCKKPFFGGLVDCEQEMAQEEQNQTKKEDLKCQTCLLVSFGAGSDKCETHGTKEVDFKCCYCCSVALFHCGGTMYMCDACHLEYVETGGRVELKDCGGKNCPLMVKHPPAHADTSLSVYPLGCGLCRTEKLDALVKSGAIVQEKTEEAFAPKIYAGYLRQQQANQVQPAQPGQPAQQQVPLREPRHQNNLNDVEMPQFFLDPDNERIEQDRAENNDLEDVELPQFFLDPEAEDDNVEDVFPDLLIEDPDMQMREEEEYKDFAPLFDDQEDSQHEEVNQLLLPVRLAQAQANELLQANVEQEIIPVAMSEVSVQASIQVDSVEVKIAQSNKDQKEMAPRRRLLLALYDVIPDLGFTQMIRSKMACRRGQ